MINERASSKTITHDVFRVTIDHGINPHNASYAYCVFPAVAASELGPVIDLPLRVVANDRDLQAVWHEELQMAAVAFYKSATCQVAPNMSITVDRPCLVLVRVLADAFAISVANPVNQPAEIAVDLRVARPSLRDRDLLIHQVVQLPGGLEAGKSVTVRCSNADHDE